MRFWRPWLGEWFGLGPGDLGDLTPTQLIMCVRHASKAKGR